MLDTFPNQQILLTKYFLSQQIILVFFIPVVFKYSMDTTGGTQKLSKEYVSVFLMMLSIYKCVS